jgi:hypothetical protein
MADIAGEAFFGGEVAVVLRDGGFEHRGTEIGSVAEAFRIRIVGEQAESMRVAAANESGFMSPVCAP